MKSFLCLCWLAVLLFGCDSASAPPPAPAPPPKTVTLDSATKIAAGQTVYVPIYSQIYTVEQRRTIDLTATLSLRNTDPSQPIIIASINYFDSSGALVRNYLEQPIQLNPMATTEIVVDQQDVSGGTGAAFVVEWVAQASVTAPVIEAVMIHTLGNQGISFISQGRVIKTR